jgi:nucleoside-diphosphate-sugar epimerase
MLEGAHVLVTGGAGFIGTKLAARLVDQNRVRVLDTLHRDALTGTELGDHANLELVRGDVRDRDGVRAAMEGVTHVVHLASIAGVDTVLQNALLTMEVCIKGTFNVLEAALEHGGLERLVDFSTSEVFGAYAYRVSEVDVTSLGAVGEARWTYAVSKLATEHLCHVMHREHELPAVTVRPFNIFGPGQVGEGAIHHFVVRALEGAKLEVHNDGHQIRAWCYIDDLIEGLLLTLVRPEAVGHAFNIGNPRTALTVYNLARLVVRMTGSASEIVHVPWPYPDVELRVPDITRARELLGFEPATDLEQGLEHTIAWYESVPAGGGRQGASSR